MRRTLAALCAVVLILLGLSTTAGAYTNGALPESALSPIASGVRCERPEGQLANEAASSWNSMALALGKPIPVNGCDSAYRPYARQLYWRGYWCSRGLCGNAAIPGTSNHGLGVAADVPTWVQGWFRLHGRRFGWRKTEAFQEPWHWNYVGGWHRPNPGTNLHSPVLRLRSGGPGQNIAVRKAQKLLRGHGFKQQQVTGSYGHATVRVVRHFQKSQRIPVTGVINARTWRKLRQPVSKPVPTTPKHVPPSGGTPAPPAHPKHHKPHQHRRHHRRRHPKGKAWGPDLSSNNGPVNFKALRAAGASFAIEKATEGTSYQNPYFSRQTMKEIGAAGLVPGVYDYVVPTAEHSGKAEAAFFTAAVGAAGYGKGWLPPAADIEETHLSDSGTCHYLGEWVHLVKRNLGVKPFIYTYGSFPGSYMAGCGWLHHYRLWIAHPSVSSPTIPAPWRRWAIWQYTWTGSVPGAGGAPMDLDKVYRGRSALVKLRVKQLPKRARLAPRAKLSLPLAGASSAELREAAPELPKAEPRAAVPAPEGTLEIATESAGGEVVTGTPSLEQALAELIHALAVAIGG